MIGGGLSQRSSRVSSLNIAVRLTVFMETLQGNGEFRGIQAHMYHTGHQPVGDLDQGSLPGLGQGSSGRAVRVCEAAGAAVQALHDPQPCGRRRDCPQAARIQVLQHYGPFPHQSARRCGWRLPLPTVRLSRPPLHLLARLPCEPRPVSLALVLSGRVTSQQCDTSELRHTVQHLTAV